MSLPVFDSTWATAYLKILITLLIFGAGIPFIVLHVSLREEVRDALQKHIPTKLWTIFLFLVVLLILSIIWLLNPENGAKSMPTNSIFAAVILSIVLIAVVSLWCYGYSQLWRKKVLHKLRDHLVDYLDRHDMLNRLILDDLIMLGENGRPGYEKKIAIESIYYIVQHTTRKPKYSDEDFRLLVEGIKKTIIGGAHQGTDEDIRCGAKYLIQSQLLNEQGLAPAGMGKKNIRRSLSELAVLAIESDYNSTALRILEMLSDDPKSLSRIGIEAISTGNYGVALACLDKLQSHFDSANGKSSERLTSLCLGLISHFRATGESGMQRAEVFIHDNDLKPSKSENKKLLVDAIAYYQLVGDYETADHLIRLKAESETQVRRQLANQPTVL